METDDLSSVWKALADPSRRKILDLVREKPITTGEIGRHFSFSRYAVMKHLNVLEAAGLVIARKEGRKRWNHLNAVPIRQIYERWVSQFEGQWAASLLNLKRGLEKQGGKMSENTFHIEQEIAIAAPVSKVFQALTDGIQEWWGAPYHLSREPSAIIMEKEAGGRLFEKWETGTALWGVVQSIEVDDHIVLDGRMGMMGATTGNVTFVVEPAEGDTTLLKLTHRAFGEITKENEMAYDKGWEDLLGTRLKAYVEEGVRYGLGHKPPMEAVPA